MQTELNCLSQSEGPDKFIVRPFLKSQQAAIITGHFTEISTLEAMSLMSNWNLPVLPDRSKEADYRTVVQRAVEEIKSGAFDKVVPARDKYIHSDTSIAELFKALLAHYPMAFVYVLSLNGKVMLGATPETLLTKEKDKLKTEALGGTKTEGAYTGKEIKEHQHIASYVEGILTRLSYEFSKGDMETKEAGPVEHLITKFELNSRGFDNDLQLLEFLHPTPAVCGFPYNQALGFIIQQEQMERGYYSGYIGPVYSNEDFYQFVNLRCAEVYAGVYRLLAGAGVNELSNPDLEFIETENKMDTIAKWLKMN